jgi:hypothetical protein
MDVGEVGVVILIQSSSPPAPLQKRGVPKLIYFDLFLKVKALVVNRCYCFNQL